MSRRVYLLGLGLALVAVGLAFTDWVLSLQPGVTEANVRRIRRGMRDEEVYSLLGPPVNDTGLLLSLTLDLSDRGQLNPDISVAAWEGADGTAAVTFDADGMVVRAYFFARQPLAPSPFARLRAWLGW
jgi:hypothetical protein